MIGRDRELLARIARMNGAIGKAAVGALTTLNEGMLSATHLRDLGAELAALAADITARADELDGVDAGPMVIDARQD